MASWSGNVTQSWEQSWLCRLSSVLQEVFLRGIPVFPSPQKTAYPNPNSIIKPLRIFKLTIGNNWVQRSCYSVVKVHLWFACGNTCFVTCEEIPGRLRCLTKIEIGNFDQMHFQILQDVLSAWIHSRRMVSSNHVATSVPWKRKAVWGLRRFLYLQK